MVFRVAVISLCLLFACESSRAPAVQNNQKSTATASKVVTLQIDSQALGVTRKVSVYLPANYSEDGPRFPVLYYLHGLGGDERDWLEGADLAHAADALSLRAIVVMPDADAGFYVDSPAAADYEACLRDGSDLFDSRLPRPENCTRAFRYESYIIADLVPWVDTHFRTVAKAEARGIAGFSMGGYGALSLAMRHPQVFGAAASHSGFVALRYTGPRPYSADTPVSEFSDPATWATTLRMLGMGQVGNWLVKIFSEEIARWRAHDPPVLAQALKPNEPALYLDCGSEDEFQFHDGARYLHDLLTARRLPHEFHIIPGRHDFAFVTTRLPFSLRFFRQHLSPQP